MMHNAVTKIMAPGKIIRAFTLFVALFSFLIAPTSVHAQNSKYAAFIIHAESGDILFDRYSTQHRYPASLTKMMTLYMLFEEMEQGRISLKSELKVSKTAAGQPPSKLGVRAGTTIDVDTAIKALVVKSANDVAVVVAERIGGSEWKFAKKMTTKARQIGMRKTTFKNASGLPNSKQLTTARDMAELSRRLFQDFPQYTHYFSTKKFTWKKRTYTTHNSLVKNYRGANGIKTGYTRRSGFNLATSATRNGTPLIGIVLGGRSSHTRDKHMREILDTAFAKVAKAPSLISALHRVKPSPRLKPSPYGDAPTIAGNSFLQAQLDQSRNGFTSTNSGLSSPFNINQQQHLLNRDQLANLINREDNNYVVSQGDTDIPANSSGFQDSNAQAPNSINDLLANNLTNNNDRNSLFNEQWSVQIGAYSTSADAAAQLEQAATLAGLSKDKGQVIPLIINDKPKLYRARFFFSDRQKADAGCKTLQNKGIGCFVAANAS